MKLGNDKSVCEILTRLKRAKAGDRPVQVNGTWGSFAPLLTAHLSEQLKRPILYISPHIDDADNAADDMTVFCGRPIDVFPVWEDSESFRDATDEIAAQRLRMTLALCPRGNPVDFSKLIMSAGIQALNQPVPSPEVVYEAGLTLKCNQTIEPELILSWLTDKGFERVDRVDMPGQYAQRGGIIDIFSPVTGDLSIKSDSGSSREYEPVRIEFFGDTIDSIRLIDLDSQRSTHEIDRITVISGSITPDSSRTELFVHLLPKETIIILEEPGEIEDVSTTFLDRLDDPRGLYPWQAVYQAIQNYTVVEISRFAYSGSDEAIQLQVSSAQQFEHKGGPVFKTNESLLDDLLKETQDRQVLFYCENPAEISRIREIIEANHGQVPEQFHLVLGYIKQGFIVDSLKTVVITHHEVFGQVSVRRRIRAIRSVSPVESMLDLNKGDYIVHISYGVGKFVGIKTMTKGQKTDEYLSLEFADKVLIHVPVRNIHLVQKYVGVLAKRPQLSKIGSKKWENQKQRVAKGVQELAEQLLEIQAKRKKMGGICFNKDSVWQNEFEESFLYQETPDQISANNDIKSDMTSNFPMDRLLCGDVGYGKTELAMRGAFKAVDSGKQVAVLVPTTVLCVQHGRTFRERFADFPVRIEILNRFVTAKQSREIIAAAKKGQVDILIGTHRLLSKDVGFKNLGLLIIDEEQRFGVEHKERLKQFRINVDILTMTATPIPRTLHMSLLGLRDISSLATPPLDRRSITTRVCRYDPETIRKAILHELNRQGQVFFLHNRVQSIVRMAETLKKIINDPHVRIDIAHGQMAKHELEDAMINFVVGKTQVLVCSTIIESGLDIPNANTMIVNEADRFGLAQLHQLRGRVGRYKHRAYAYMLLPMNRKITPIAARRLKAIEEFSELGSGFRIALRDLEIRGAGNILGPEQSGHINMVGYEMYCRMLDQAVKRLKNEPVEQEITTVIELGFSVYIPKSYIPSDKQRMDVYRRIATAVTGEDLEKLRYDLKDLFGPVPEQVQLLIDLTELKIAAASYRIKSLVVSKPDIIFSFETDQGVGDIFARCPGKVSIPDPKTVYVRPGANYFEPMTLMSILRKILRVKSY